MAERVCYAHTMRLVDRYRQSVLRLVAVVLVCVLVGDIVSGAHCDDTTSSSTTASLSQTPESPADACASVCVPDCYCCARGIEVPLVLVLPFVGIAALMPVPTVPSPPDGVSRLPYHPPLIVA